MKTKYKIGFNSDGTIVAMESDIYSNCGFSLDASFSVSALFSGKFFLSFPFQWLPFPMLPLPKAPLK